MKACLGVNGLKTFSRVLRFLARIGNELYFEATQEGLIMRVVNTSKTCFCSITLNAIFFTTYSLTGDEYDANNCRVSARPLLQVLKNIKQIISCQLQLDSSKERLVVDISKMKDVQVQYSVVILEHENLEDFELPKKDFSTLICHPVIIGNLLNNIPKTLREFAFDVTTARTEIRNHINHPDKDVETVRLKYKLDPAEFTSYDVAENSRLILSSQDFMSIVELAETSGHELKIIFTTNGKPLIASFEMEDVVKVQMVMSTMREETLKTMNKPTGATSYKALMGSYIERRSLGDLTDQSSKQLSETVMSPRIDSFQAHSKNLKPATAVKRKSSELIASSPAAAVPSLGNSKKQKTSESLTQEEQQEVSKMLVDLENVADEDNPEEEEDEILENPPRNTSSLNQFAGISVRIQRSIQNTESSTPERNGSYRFDVSKANFPSEALIAHESLQISSHEAFDENHLPEIVKTSSQIKRAAKTKHYARTLFNPANKTLGQEMYAHNSDSEMDEAERDESNLMAY